MATKVLVTGAGGFIGSHLVEMLLQDGCDVRAMVRYTSGNTHGNLPRHLLNTIDLYKGDLRDAETVYKAMDSVDTVYPVSYTHLTLPTTPYV